MKSTIGETKFTYDEDYSGNVTIYSGSGTKITLPVEDMLLFAAQQREHIAKQLEDLPEVKLQGEAPMEPVYWVGRQWVVSAYGVEARDGTYPIDKQRLWEDDNGHGWEQQIGEKTWADMSDFRRALAVARKRFAHLKPKDAAA
jgi:hypothetical protein